MFLLLSISRVTVLHASESAFRSFFSAVREGYRYDGVQTGRSEGDEAARAADLPLVPWLCQ